MLNALRKSKARKEAVEALHATIVGRARAPVFYAELQVPDTVDGRFDLLALHAWMVLARLRETGPNDLSQALVDRLFLGLDGGLRDLGVGDMGMLTRMKKLGDAFFGRLKTYEASTTEDAMREAVLRNLYRGQDNPHAARLARYALAARAHLAGADPAAAPVDFGPLP
jgi:cytochrome b pre-mRNA-processing protein 3